MEAWLGKIVKKKWHLIEHNGLIYGGVQFGKKEQGKRESTCSTKSKRGLGGVPMLTTGRGKKGNSRYERDAPEEKLEEDLRGQTAKIRAVKRTRSYLCRDE